MCRLVLARSTSIACMIGAMMQSPILRWKAARLKPCAARFWVVHIPSMSWPIRAVIVATMTVGRVRKVRLGGPIAMCCPISNVARHGAKARINIAVVRAKSLCAGAANLIGCLIHGLKRASQQAFATTKTSTARRQKVSVSFSRRSRMASAIQQRVRICTPLCRAPISALKHAHRQRAFCLKARALLASNIARMR